MPIVAHKEGREQLLIHTSAQSNQMVLFKKE